MKPWKALSLVFAYSFLMTLSLATSAEEERKLEFWVELFNKNSDAIEFKSLSLEGDLMKKKAFIISNWDRVFDNKSEESIAKAKEQLTKVSLVSFPTDLKLKGLILKKRLGLDIEEVERDLRRAKWRKSDYWSYLSLKENYSELLEVEGLDIKSNDLFLWESEFKKAIAKDEWSDGQKKKLLSYDPNWRRSLRGYKGKIRLYMLCRHNRDHPCLLVMKDASGRWHKNSEGKLWSQPKLGLSRHGLPAHQVNGDTPQGIYTIDSVMPEANRQIVFGKFRRLILNFIPQSRKEKDFKSLMPKETHGLSWWQEGMVARDIGRSLLRIHGTGTINTDPASSWYPFYPTSGCIASRENLYDGVDYQDQRTLLDEMMKAAGLKVSYANEAKLKGLLYVVDVDSQETPVTSSEIEKLISL
jgi:hypothetical protein